MALMTSSPSSLGNALQTLMMAQQIVPGDSPSYSLCKTIAAYHPLGQKMTESPIRMAQSQRREIRFPSGPESDLIEAFEAEWKKFGADKHIFNIGRLARVYGVASLAILTADESADTELDFKTLYAQRLAVNVFDPLNTSGSLVLSQLPNNLDFQKVKDINVQGSRYHRSRTVVLLNEEPYYLEWTTSAYGYVGRSVFQRALFPLKSFIQTMITDDMVSLKAGVLIAKIKQAGSIVNQAMRWIAGEKREMVKEAVTNNVISINTDEEISSLNLQNLDGAFGAARKNILDNIATAADMPAVILNQETFAEGFGEGTEDAKRVVQYIDFIRQWLQPAYDFFDQVVMYRALNEEFFAALQKRYPDAYGSMTWEEAFNEWRRSFSASWPSYLQEPESEQVKVADVKLKAVIALLEVLLPAGLGAEAKAKLIIWAQSNFNELKTLFGDKLDFDYEELLEAYQASDEASEEQRQAMLGGAMEMPKPAPPFSARDSVKHALAALDAAEAKLPVRGKPVLVDIQPRRGKLVTHG